jgi:uncharacterized protein (TIGR02117 family)
VKKKDISLFIFFKALIKATGIFISAVIALVAWYVLAAFLLTMIADNTSFQETETGIEIYVQTNGAHTNIVLPVENELYNWKEFIDTSQFKQKGTAFTHISFGWGDKEFYISTPTWSDLKFSTALKALFWPTSTAMYVTYYESFRYNSSYMRRIKISAKEYKHIIHAIKESFQTQLNGTTLLIDCCRYDNMNDNFYEAKGSYHLFKTCNNWTNDVLRRAGVKCALWAPFDKCVLYHLPE